MRLLRHENRVVAVDLASRGFGYAVFDGPRHLVDWGTRQVKGDVDAECITRIKALLDWYTPEVLVLEDCEAPGCRKRQRIRALAKEAARLGEAMGINVIVIPWTLVRGVCGRDARATKDRVAASVAVLFPELKRHLPPPRKLWMSEDYRLNLFDAVGLGVTAYVIGGR